MNIYNNGHSDFSLTCPLPILNTTCNCIGNYPICLKGQIKPIADWRAIDSPKKRTNIFFNLHGKTKTKTNLLVRFLGESTARKSACGFIWPLVKFTTIFWRMRKDIFIFVVEVLWSQMFKNCNGVYFRIFLACLLGFLQY